MRHQALHVKQHMVFVQHQVSVRATLAIVYPAMAVQVVTFVLPIQNHAYRWVDFAIKNQIAAIGALVLDQHIAMLMEHAETTVRKVNNRAFVMEPLFVMLPIIQIISAILLFIQTVN